MNSVLRPQQIFRTRTLQPGHLHLSYPAATALVWPLDYCALCVQGYLRWYAVWHHELERMPVPWKSCPADNFGGIATLVIMHSGLDLYSLATVLMIMKVGGALTVTATLFRVM